MLESSEWLMLVLYFLNVLLFSYPSTLSAGQSGYRRWIGRLFSYSGGGIEKCLHAELNCTFPL